MNRVAVIFDDNENIYDDLNIEANKKYTIQINV